MHAVELRLPALRPCEVLQHYTAAGLQLRHARWVAHAITCTQPVVLDRGATRYEPAGIERVAHSCVKED